jgi:hypothetical protein
MKEQASALFSIAHVFLHDFCQPAAGARLAALQFGGAFRR